MTVNCEPETTWAEVKKQIARDHNLSISRQRLIHAGRVLDDNRWPYDDRAQTWEVIHLVMMRGEDITLETHNLYLSVHNFYNGDNFCDSTLHGLQYAIPLTGQETDDELHGFFEAMYEIRAARIAKNGGGGNHAIPVFSLVGVKKPDFPDNITLVPNDDGKSSALLVNNDTALPYEFLTYMLPGTESPADVGIIHGDRLKLIHRAFRIFCATKAKEDPNYIRQQDEKYFAVRAYLESTVNLYFSADALLSHDVLLAAMEELLRHNVWTEVEQSAFMARMNITDPDSELPGIISEFNIMSMRQSFPDMRRHPMSDATYREETREILRRQISNLRSERMVAAAPVHPVLTAEPPRVIAEPPCVDS